jgi:hypothetical protein
MPMLFQGLTTVAKNAYTEESWHIMSSAHEIPAFHLQRSTRTDPNAERLAREVMRLFNNGKRDVNNIASLAADSESTLEAKAGKNRVQRKL